jgi:hypothetical protein
MEAQAEMEHERWLDEKREAEYSYAPGPKDDVAKTDPALIPWSGLGDGFWETCRSLVRQIPEAVKEAGLAVVKTG